MSDRTEYPEQLNAAQIPPEVMEMIIGRLAELAQSVLRLREAVQGLPELDSQTDNVTDINSRLEQRAGQITAGEVVNDGQAAMADGARNTIANIPPMILNERIDGAEEAA